MTLPCLLIPAIVGLVCALLGYLLGKLFGNKTDSNGSLQNDLDICQENVRKYKNQIANLEADLAQSASNLTASKQSFAAPAATAAASVFSFNSIVAKTVFGKTIKEDDLKIVEGIGPKIEELFKTAGITTWKLLSEAPTTRLQEILNAAGERFAIHNPGTWARQAKMAYEGKWQDLKDWQETLDGGKE